MKRIVVIVSLITLAASSGVTAQTRRPEEARVIIDKATKEEARVIVDKATKKAQTSGKTVFLIFRTSSCDRCDRLDAVLESSEIRDVIEGNYVVARIDVTESSDNANPLENPGGREILTELGGATSPLPFYAFLDGKGRKLGDSSATKGLPSASEVVHGR